MAWSYPILTAMKTVAIAANSAVRAAAGNVYVSATDVEANRLRFEYAVSLVMANKELVEKVRAQLFESLRKYFLGWLVGVSPLVRLVVGFAIEAAYQAMKAASATQLAYEAPTRALIAARDSYRIEPVPPPDALPPESIVEVRDMAPGFEGEVEGFASGNPEPPEPGNESMVGNDDDHAIGFHVFAGVK